MIVIEATVSDVAVMQFGGCGCLVCGGQTLGGPGDHFDSGAVRIRKPERSRKSHFCVHLRSCRFDKLPTDPADGGISMALQSGGFYARYF